MYIQPAFALGPLGMPELIIVLVIILLVFGVGKLPDVASSVGKGIREFRRGQSGEADESKPTQDSKAEAEGEKS